MTTDQILLGVGLILALAVGSQVLAAKLRIPALIVLLPVGFTAGAITTDVNPERLLGASFEPLVSLAVAVILYDAGLGLDVRKLRGHARRVVVRLILYGLPVTWAFGTVSAALLLGFSTQAALMLGAILVVSGPTVVGPLLRFIQPTERLQRVLAWEGSLIDPAGAVLGAVVFHAVLGRGHWEFGHQAVQFLFSIGVGLAGGLVGTALLWFLLRTLGLGEVLGTTAQLACVVAVAAACDIARDDAGLIAAIMMGLSLANLRGFDVPARRPFFETFVQLIIGVLFVSISATVTPASLRHLVLPTLGLVAVLVLLARPLVAFLATARTDLSRGERQFTGWMAPRGIVAAATASTFSAGLAKQGIGGAAQILPVTFLVIVATVGVYGLTAVPVARRLGVARPDRSRPLLVGGQAWVIDLARALGSAGLEVALWAGAEAERQRIRQAGLELTDGELLAAATGQGAELEGFTAVYLLTEEDDFNALGSAVLGGTGSDLTTYRVGAREPDHGVVAPYLGGEVVFAPGLSGADLSDRYARGARVITRPADGARLDGARLDGVRPDGAGPDGAGPDGAGPDGAGGDLLFRVRADGRLDPVTRSATPPPRPGDTLILLGPASDTPAALSTSIYGSR